MKMSDLVTVILGAGKGTRMKSDLPKVLHPILGKPMINYVIRVAERLGSDRIIVVVGHQADRVKNVVGEQYPEVEYALQEPQLGTAHAVQQAADMLRDYRGNVLILSGDVPLIDYDTLQEMFQLHNKMQASLTLMTTVTDNPTGYGRIKRGFDGMVQEIVEEKDIQSEVVRNIHEVNCGIYLFRSLDLFAHLGQVKNENSQGEYYLPDLVSMFGELGLTIATFQNDDMSETHGVNTIEQLKEVESILVEKQYKDEH